MHNAVAIASDRQRLGPIRRRITVAIRLDQEPTLAGTQHLSIRTITFREAPSTRPASIIRNLLIE